jgi:hypothetical protein
MSNLKKNNIILSGFRNKIENSELCSIINGSNNEIKNAKNTHIVGEDIQTEESDVFWVGCENGLKCSGDIIAFSLSDKRLKDNIKPLENCLEKILSLDAIGFEWNDKQNTYSGKDIGLIAQQVESIAPEIVETRKNGYKAIKYEKLIPLLIGAIKEQSLVIDKIERLLNINELH